MGNVTSSYIRVRGTLVAQLYVQCLYCQCAIFLTVLCPTLKVRIKIIWTDDTAIFYIQDNDVK